MTYDSIVNTCKSVAQLQGYADPSSGTWNYYISIIDTALYVRACCMAVGLNKTVSNSILLSTVQTETQNDRPCLLNLGYYNSVNVDHTVTAIGWRTYNIIENDGFISNATFYKVIDGDCNTYRYLYSADITGFFVTKVS